MSRDMSSGIKMSKGSHEINFGTTVHMPKEVLYVVVLTRRQVSTQNHKRVNVMPTNAVKTAVTIRWWGA
jgi:hypothetical protein